MRLLTFLYVSDSRLAASAAEGELRDLVAWSRTWNWSVGITGALAFTEVNFSQYIEGPAEAVMDLMTKLLRDPRHENIDMVRGVMVPERRFAGWSLVYAGPPMLMDDLISPLRRRKPGAPMDEPADRLLAAFEAMTALGGGAGAG